MALIFLLLSTLSFGSQIISSTEPFSISVPAPSVIFECKDSLVVYSKERKDLTFFSTEDGKNLGQYAISSPKKSIVTEGTCFNDQLIIVFSEPGKTNSFSVYKIEGSKLKIVSNFGSPEKGLVTDLRCDEVQCWKVISGKVYKTSNFKQWQPVAIKKTSDIKSKEINTDTNPFDDWQDKLILSQGLLTKVLPLENGRLALLDPIRATVILSENDGSFSRWGKFGTWEGFLLSPKDFALYNKNYFFIIDTALKVISVFDVEGSYLGLIGIGKEFPQLQYPSHITTSDRKIFVSDLFANKVWVFELPSTISLNDARLSKDFTRVNLFRRKEVLKDRIKNRCLLCHDGTMKDDTDKYIHENFNHPLGVKPDSKVDLPLTEGSLVTCSTCHDPHHGGTMAKGSESLKAPYLRKPKEQLCASCHKKESDPLHNHSGHKNNSCLECHTPHGGAEKVLKESTPALCLKCHSKENFEHRPVSHFLSTDRAKNTHFVNNKISCITCHSPHGADSSKKILRPPLELTAFCASCHDEKAVMLLKNFHKRKWKK